MGTALSSQPCESLAFHYPRVSVPTTGQVRTSLGSGLGDHVARRDTPLPSRASTAQLPGSRYLAHLWSSGTVLGSQPSTSPLDSQTDSCLHRPSPLGKERVLPTASSCVSLHPAPPSPPGEQMRGQQATSPAVLALAVWL